MKSTSLRTLALPSPAVLPPAAVVAVEVSPEALRKAQEEVRSTRGFEHPRFRAAFQLVGAG